MCKRLFFVVAAVVAVCSCEKVENVGETVSAPSQEKSFVTLEDVATLFSSIRLGPEQMEEVHHAALCSVANGYDEEYRMRDVFEAPGAGVGDGGVSSKAGGYSRPLRDLLREAAGSFTKAGAGSSAWLDSLSTSDVQIYWPFSEDWDGSSLPVITYDPGDYVTSNVGYALRADGGFDKVMVDERMAMERPVWVMNRNSDAGFMTLEMRQKEDLIVNSVKATSGMDIKSLFLRSFKAKRQYDSWFSGASEFFLKVGSVEDFTASTEAELRLYEPTITDFMIVVRRKQVDKDIDFNAVLVSEWTSALSNVALMITEDDGGTRTTWKCNAVVKVSSKSYGFEIEIPLYTHDDVVWRGSLTRNYIERYSGEVGHFGDVDMVLELI